MDEMQEKLGAILNNPQMMQTIMSMAQSMGSQQQKQEPQQQEPSNAPALPNIDPGMLQKLSGAVRQGNLDRDQQALLKALSPYLSRDRISKLERAMRAAKMARIAATFLGQGGLQSFSGR